MGDFVEELEYEFEPMDDGRFQVRLQGEFITYTDHQDPEKVDALLAANDWESREQYLNALYEEHKI